MMRRTVQVVLVAALTAVVVLAADGCGRIKQARQGVQQAQKTAKAARELQQTGQTTMTDEKGNKVTLKTGGGEGGPGQVTITDEKGKQTASWSGDGKQGQMSFTDEKGQKTTVTSGTDVTEADLGLKFYPGATVKTGTKSAAGGAKAASSATVQLATKDPMDKVTAFYKGQYAKGNQVMEMGEGVMIMIGTPTGGSKQITISPDKESGETLITLLSAEGG